MKSPAFVRFTFVHLYIRKIRRRFGYPISFTPSVSRGRVLLSYTTHPFTITEGELLRSPHTNSWECIGIVEALLQRGFAVDIIDWTNNTFVPKHKYVLCIDIHTNLERLAPLLPRTCKKIFYATGAAWRYQNTAEQERIEALKLRRGILVSPRRQVPEEHPDTVANAMTTLGSPFAASTYEPLGVRPVRIPLPSMITFASPHDKDFDAARNSYLFIGGGGAVHKGLDIVLEFFASHPKYSLTVCGPYEHEKDFVDAYHQELYGTPNITFLGRINLKSETFLAAIRRSIGIVYPSCSEGQSGSVISALHAGLIPLLTPQSGVDSEPFGRTIPEVSSAGIGEAIAWLSSLSTQELRERATAVWEYANKVHTYENFVREYGLFLDTIAK